MSSPWNRIVAVLFAGLLVTSIDAQAKGSLTQTQATQSSLAPADALRMLKEGNERFVQGRALERDHREQVAITAKGQYPFAVVLGCIDSRSTPEIVFDLGIGDVFAPRIAGNFVNTDIIGSMEFATAAAGSRAIVVLGHSACGAVKGACDNVELGNLTHTLSNIAPAVYAVKGFEGARDSKNAAFVAAVTEANVRMTVQNILDRSPVLKGLVDEGKLVVVGAMHDLGTGRVSWLEN